MKFARGARWLACLCLPVLTAACGGDAGATFPDSGGAAGSAGTGGMPNGGAAGSVTTGGAGGGANGGSGASGADGGSGASGASRGNAGGAGEGGATGGSGGSSGGAGAGGATGGAAGSGGSGAGGTGAVGGGGSGSTDDLLISEYLEGSANNKALEIYNASAGSVELSGCSLQFYFASSDNTQEIKLSGSLRSKQTFVVCHVDAAPAIASRCDLKSDAYFFNGDDAIELVCSNALVDSFGQRGVDPGEGWGDPSSATFTKDHTLRRKCSVSRGDTQSTNAFDPALEWEGFAIDASQGLGRHCSD